MSHLQLACAILLTLPGVGWGQAFIEHLSPPVVRRGTTSRMEVLGTETANSVGIWTSLPSGTFSARIAGDAKSPVPRFDIDIPANAPLGVYGLRLATTSEIGRASCRERV